MSKISNAEIVKNGSPSVKFPKVVVDQTNVRISDLIRRNLAGEQVFGNTHLAFDYSGEEDPKAGIKVNPFNNIGFDLDDVIKLANENGKTIQDLQDRKGALDVEKAKLLAEVKSQKQKEIDQAKQIASQEKVKSDGE